MKSVTKQRCPYCNVPVVLDDRLANGVRPDPTAKGDGCAFCLSLGPKGETIGSDGETLVRGEHN